MESGASVTSLAPKVVLVSTIPRTLCILTLNPGLSNHNFIVLSSYTDDISSVSSLWCIHAQAAAAAVSQNGFLRLVYELNWECGADDLGAGVANGEPGNAQPNMCDCIAASFQQRVAQPQGRMCI